jgi:uncharacterized protein (TIGR02284 family)
MENQKTIDTLNHLIAIAKDGKEGYKNAAKDVKDSTMKNIFEKYAAQRDKYTNELQQEVERLGGDARENGGPLGALHRTWMDMKSVFASGDRDAIIKACITGEESAIKNYDDALKNESITGSTRFLLEQQRSGVTEALNEIKQLQSKEEKPAKDMAM